jgi:hypothetical protein
MKGRMKCPHHPDMERRALMMKRDPVVRLGSEMFERLQATATTTTKKKNVTTGRTQRRLASEVLERLQATATTATMYALVSAWEFVWLRAWIGKVRGGRLPAAKCGGKSVVSEHSSVLAPCIREPVQCLYTKQFLYEKGSIKGKIKSAKQDMR